MLLKFHCKGGEFVARGVCVQRMQRISLTPEKAGPSAEKSVAARLRAAMDRAGVRALR